MNRKVRTWLCTSRAVFVVSTTENSGSISPAWLTPSAACGSPAKGSGARSRATASRPRSTGDRSVHRLSGVTSSGIGMPSCWARTGPASDSSFMRWTVTPKCGSPFRIAHNTGAGPRYWGSIEH
jgi:hypothetical protein